VCPSGPARASPEGGSLAAYAASWMRVLPRLMSCSVPPITTTLVRTPTMRATCCFHGVPPTRKLVFRSWLVVPALLEAMQTTVPIDSAAAVYACPVQPSATKIRHTPISVAIAMPLTGLDEEPSSPALRSGPDHEQ